MAYSVTDSKNCFKQRSFYWDNCKGFLILLVVFAHFLYDLQLQHEWNTLLVNAIYMFHMPAFVFVSGYFTKSDNSRSLRSMLILGVAYFLYTAGFIIYNLFHGIPEISLAYPYYSAWYILALIIWRLTAPYLAKIRGILFILCAFSILSGFWAEFDLKYTAVKVIVFSPFFMAGYLLKHNSVTKIQDWCTNRWHKLLSVFLLTGIAIIFASFIYRTFNITLQDLLPNYYVKPGISQAIARAGLLVTATLVTLSMLFITVEKQIPLLTRIGKNSLAIYLLHRPVTLWFTNVFYYNSEQEQIIKACVGTILLVGIFGSEIVSNLLKGFLYFCGDSLLDLKESYHFKFSVCRILLLGSFLIILLLPMIGQLSHRYSKDPLYRVMDLQMQERYNKSFRLLFCGDLILLEDQVKNAFNGKSYDFTPCFEYTSKYITAADFAVGVFEGPLGGTLRNYSQSNYDDGKTLYLNFPDEFADAVKLAGFDLVTTANNHLLDMGEEGVNRTIKILREKGLNYTGSYLDFYHKETERVKIVEKDGIRMAFLSYTYGLNNYETERILESNLVNRTSFLVGKGSPHYDKIKESVRNDFVKAKSYNPDLIVVLPHWGTKFSDAPDAFQKTWKQNFLEFGADIIFGDHTHSVQPMEMKEINGKMTYTLFCPGNYANIYREHNGDASALVEVAIDRNTKKIFAGSIVPMWTESAHGGNYRALPIWDILTNTKLGKEISTYDMERVNEVVQHITNIMLKAKLDTNMVQERLYFDDKGFLRKKTDSLAISDEMKKGKLFPLLKNAKTVCFIGDSLTEGTKNGGVPWYEPMEHVIAGTAKNISIGGCTTNMLLEKSRLQEIVSAEADLYVIAIGTNDVCYRDAKICAMNTEEYIDNLKRLQNEIQQKNPSAQFVFIAPWISTDGDIVSKLSFDEKTELNREYSLALQQWCYQSKHVFINANDYIGKVLNRYPHNRYLIDFIHPNGREGVKLYSEAVLLNK